MADDPRLSGAALLSVAVARLRLTAAKARMRFKVADLGLIRRGGHRFRASDAGNADADARSHDHCKFSHRRQKPRNPARKTGKAKTDRAGWRQKRQSSRFFVAIAVGGFALAIPAASFRTENEGRR
ncbi:MAG: hypothetical protein U1E55_10610 [Paracoccus sp. (in: a-proteobacteria)]